LYYTIYNQHLQLPATGSLQQLAAIDSTS